MKKFGQNKQRLLVLFLQTLWGFFDMHGNVREMTLDRYKDYSRGIAIDPWIKNGGKRVEPEDLE